MIKRIRSLCLPIIVGSVSAFTSVANSQSPNKTEVVLVTTIHLAHLLHPQNSPAHLRALIAKLHPDVLAIENPPEWQRAGRYYWAFMPENYVAAGYVAERGIPLVGINWETPVDSLGCLWTPERKAATHRSTWIRNSASSQSKVAFAEEPLGIDAVQRKTRWEFLDSDDRSFAQDSAAAPRENRIAANIIQVASSNPGKRVVVLLGQGHGYTQTLRLKAVPGIRLIESSSFLPLTAQEIKKAQRQSDLPILLGANLESLIGIAAPQSRNHQRTRELLTELARVDKGGAFTAYYDALWHRTMGRYREAAAQLERVLAHPSHDSLAWLGTPQWAWPPLQRLHDKALFARASLYDLQGDHRRAAELYQQLLDSLPAPALHAGGNSPLDYYDLATYFRLLIRDGYRGGDAEIDRTSDFRECARPDGMPGPARSSSARHR